MVKKRPTNISTVTRPKKNKKEVRFNFEESDGSDKSCDSPYSPDIDKNDPKTFFN